jgi:hypothetical protein
LATKRKPVPLEPEAPGMDPMHISRSIDQASFAPKKPKERPENAVCSVTGDVIYKPWDGPQLKLWTTKARYAAILGSGFTGKSQELLYIPFQQVEEDDRRIAAGEIKESKGHALFLRREMPMLREVMNRASLEFKLVCPDLGSREGWRATEKTYYFPNGYRYTFGHMENEEDWQKYQGWQISCLLWDEICTFTEHQFDMMDTWCRQPAGSKLTAIVRAGGNPIGIGRAWVKNRFGIKKGERYREFEKTGKYRVQDEDGTWREEAKRRAWVYIHILVSDNKSVDQADYLASFEGKPANVVKALRDGDFDAATGDLVGLCWDETIHIVRPFVIPSTRHLFRSCHFTYAETTVQWFAVDYDGNLTCYRELHLKDHTAKMVAERIREIEEYAKEPREWSVDPDDGSKLIGVLGPVTAWERTKQRGPSPAETMRRVGIRWTRADDNLGAAADQIRDRLLSRTLDGTLKKSPGVPGLRFFDDCKHSIEEIPSMPADKNDKDCPDPKAPATAYSAMCYAAMSRPLTPDRSKTADDDWEKWDKPKSTRKSRTSYPGLW